VPPTSSLEMASEAEFNREAHKEFDTPNKRKRKSSVGIPTTDVIKLIARDLKKRDTGGSVITVAYYFDKNKDKTLSKSEFFEMLGSLGFGDITEDVSNDIFVAIDTNEDGKIDYFEFIKAMNEAVGERSFKKQLFTPPPPEIVKPTKETPTGFGSGRTGLTVYVGKKIDPFSAIVLIALEEMGLKYEKRELSETEIQSEEFGQQNPRHQVPVVVTYGGVLHEAVAILTFLAITNRPKVGGFPLDSPTLAKTLTRLSETQHLFKVYRDTVCFTGKENWKELRDERTKVEKAIHEEFKLWNSHIEGDFILGEEISLVDAAVFPILNWFYSHDTRSLDQYHRLKVFHDNFSKRRSVVALRK